MSSGSDPAIGSCVGGAGGALTASAGWSSAKMAWVLASTKSESSGSVNGTATLNPFALLHKYANRL
jgi:hypothetical protein